MSTPNLGLNLPVHGTISWDTPVNSNFSAIDTASSNIRHAELFTGADAGAKINAADSNLGATAGEIWVSTATGSIATAVSISANHTLRFLPGTYSQSATITLSGANSKLIGCGSKSTILSNTTAATPSVAFSGGGCEIRDIQLTRTITATSGGNGINQTGGDSNLIADVLVQNQYVGVSLGVTSWSVFRDAWVQKNQSDGILFSSTAGQTAYQWQLTNVLSMQNTGVGFHASNTNASQLILGQWTNISTFANTGGGIVLSGASASYPVDALRLVGGFIGADDVACIFLDTYGTQHQIIGVQVESAGTSATGPTLSHAASNAAHNIQITGNNLDVQIIGCNVHNAAYDGIVTSAGHSTIAGCHVFDNGQASSAANQIGIYVAAGIATVSGNHCYNRSGTQQLYGVYSHVDNCWGAGNYLTGTTKGFGADVALANSEFGQFNSSSVTLTADSGALTQTAWTDVPNASITMWNSSGDVLLTFFAPLNLSGGTASGALTFNVDGTDLNSTNYGYAIVAQTGAGGVTFCTMQARISAPAAGQHTYKVRYKVPSGSTLNLYFAAWSNGTFSASGRM